MRWTWTRYLQNLSVQLYSVTNCSCSGALRHRAGVQLGCRLSPRTRDFDLAAKQPGLPFNDLCPRITSVVSFFFQWTSLWFPCVLPFCHWKSGRVGGLLWKSGASVLLQSGNPDMISWLNDCSRTRGEPIVSTRSGFSTCVTVDCACYVQAAREQFVLGPTFQLQHTYQRHDIACFCRKCR